MDATAERVDRIGQRAWIILAAALLFAGAVPLISDRAVQIGLAAISVTLAVVSFGLWVAKRMRAKRARRQLEGIMTFVEHDSAPAFCTDQQGAIVVQNRAAADRFGPAPGGVLSRVLEPLFANPDAVVHRLREQLRDHGSAREDVVTRRGHVRVSAHRVPDGELWRLEDMVDRPTRTGDGIGLPMLTVGSSGTILYMNEPLRSALGRRITRLDDLFDDLPLRNGAVHRMRAGKEPVEVRVVLSRPVADRKEIFLLPVEEGAHQDTGSDLTRLLDSLPIAVLRIDGRGNVVSLNRLALKLLPAAAEGNLSLAALVEGLGRSVDEWVAEAIDGRGLNRPEVVRVSHQGERYLQITLGRPLTSDGRGLIAVLNDATEFKSIEAQFVQSQKMQAIGQLAGGVAHDFNNLLTAISGHCDLLLLRRQEDDPDYADLSQINQNANRAASLVGQLLAFSRQQPLSLQHLDLRETLSEMTHLLNRLLGERVRLILDHDPALVAIRGDKRQLEQVLMNLVVNARDAMPDGGEVRITTRCRYLERGLTRDRVTVPPGFYVVVIVTDQGVGIPPERIGRIFEPFYTTKKTGEGTGLGLSMAYGIVKQSGGYIFADSEPGTGASFTLYFPAGHDQTAAASEETAMETFDLSRSTRSPDAVDSGTASPLHLPAPDVPAMLQTANGDVIEAETADGDPGSGEKRDPADIEGDITGVNEVAPVDIVASVENAEATDADNSDHSPRSGRAGTSDQAPAAEAAPKRHIPVPEEGGEDELLSRVADAAREDGFEYADEDGRYDSAATDAPEERELTVLLVEDEAPVRAFASRALRLKGYAVVEADSAEDALSRLSDESLHIDLFLTDVMMPGKDGPTWIKEAREMRPDVPTVFVSGYTQRSLIDGKMPVPNSTFLPKPFSLSELSRAVVDVLEKHRDDRPAA
ncbi:Blue-light-activated protein [Jannaschia aquimarina]|uniref:histidine kinase n=1 Tax=Jannaschia aquimarina TaxID=935700 RepID=A0A0D1EFJ9_9RHOB|nr:Blue-light-activated protein [Jannaschia aquimarina]SNT03770.1 His Kinase A (phospho-acceptor) domain-containing protein [Jannaschia aquimarina]